MVEAKVVLAKHMKQNTSKKRTHAESDESKKKKLRRVIDSIDEESDENDDENE